MFLQDLNYAFRSLIRDRGVTSVVVLCLALGIGVNATLFATIDGVLIQPLPFAEADRLLILSETFERGGIREGAVSYQNLRDWKAQSTAFSSIAATANRSLALADGGGEAERYLGATITWDMFPTLGVPPALGRHFNDTDDRPGAEPVIIISDEIWQRRYSADPGIIGRRVTVNARPHTIVGVMPPGFQFPQNHKAWIPIAPLAHDEARDVHNLFAFGRLKPGVDIVQARTDMSAMAARLAADYPLTNEGRSAVPRPLTDEFIPDDVRLVLLTMMGAVTLVLLIACANVANLMLARATSRQREYSVRSALGASRARLVRQLLTECVLLGLAAAPLGLGVAYLGVWLLDGAVPVGMVPYYIHWEVSGRIVAYTVVVSALSGLVFGLAPALQAGRLNIQETLRDGARGSGTSGSKARVRNGLVIAEVALALVLLVGASLFVRSFLNLQSASPGFDTSQLLTLRFYMAGETYADDEPKAQRVDDIIRRIEALPGVEAAFASNFIALGGGGGGGFAVVDGQTVAVGEERSIGFTAVTPHLYRTMGLSILKGRDFTEAEGASRSPVAVINNTMATRLWPSSEPVGGRFRLVRGGPDEWFTVIGIAPDIRQDDMDDDTPPQPVAYVPYRYDATPNTGVTIRASANPAALTAAVREEIRGSDRGLAIFSVQTMEDLRTAGFWQFKLFGQMFGIFGLTALFLAGIGVYAVLAFSVSQRTQEMGVRIALGAQRADVLTLVIRQGVTLAAWGIVLGMAGAFGVTRVIASLLYDVTPTDPVSFGGVALFLAVIAVVASYLPARRAMRVDPVVALRDN